MGFVFIVLSNLFAVVIPPIVREAIDGVVLLLKENKTPTYYSKLPAFFQSPSRVALLAGMLVVSSALMKGVFMYFMRQTLIVMSRYIEFDLKNDIFKKYQNLGQGFYNRNYTGDLMNRISDDVSKVRMFAGPAIMYTLNLSVMILLVVSIMFWVNAKITLYVLIPLPILALTIYLVSDKMNKQSDVIQKKLSGITSYVQETFAGIQVLKAFAAEKDFSNDFDNINEDYKEANMVLVKINGVFMPTVIGLIGMSILITLFVGGNEVIKGDFSLGNIVEYVIYVNMLTWPVASLGYVTSLVQSASASQKRINEFLDEEEEVKAGATPIREFEGKITFKNVWFKYPNTDNWVLKNVSFSVPSMSKFGIIGTTGSGKSTIAKLLMGVYKPTKGEILINDIPMDNYADLDLKELFGYVSQDIFLFSDSLRNNILFGGEGFEHADNLNRAIESAGLKGEVESFPEGLETILGERGITLSGGQKQRTAIARALVKNPQILLIDDGLSAVDTKTEVKIKQHLASWNPNQTFINISHRISSVQDADHIIVLSEGEIIEEGRHQDLMDLDGIYAELFTKQMKVGEEV